MTRVRLLTAGYGALGASFLALGASAYVGALLVPGLLLALVAAVLLAFSDDEVPKWTGVALIAYFALLATAFAFASSITVRTGGRYHIESPSPELAAHVLYYMGLASPLVLAGAALAASWERERVVRYLFAGAILGMILVGVLTVAFIPDPAPPDPQLQTEDPAAFAIAQATFEAELARAQGATRLVHVLAALCGVTAAAGAFWAASRPEEYG